LRYQRYRIEITQRSRGARASLENGDLDAALSELEEAIATAEQNLGCAQVAPAMQLALIATLVRDCTSVPDRSARQSSRMRALTSRIELLLQARMARGSAGGRELQTKSQG
jgi:Tfp pilus assembly protein PilF